MLYHSEIFKTSSFQIERKFLALFHLKSWLVKELLLDDQVNYQSDENFQKLLFLNFKRNELEQILLLFLDLIGVFGTGSCEAIDQLKGYFCIEF